jgi:hypothetical protein
MSQQRHLYKSTYRFSNYRYPITFIQNPITIQKLLSVQCGLEYASEMKLTAVFPINMCTDSKLLGYYHFFYLSSVLLRAQTDGRLRGKGKTVGRI